MALQLDTDDVKETLSKDTDIDDHTSISPTHRRPKDDPSPSPHQVPEPAAMSSLKETCSSLIDTLDDDLHSSLSRYKIILSHYAEHTLYDAAARSYLVDAFFATSLSRLMATDLSHCSTDAPLASALTECATLLLRIAIPLIKCDHPLAAHAFAFCFADKVCVSMHMSRHMSMHI